MSRYKIKGTKVTDEIVRIFEENSIKVMTIKDMKDVINKIIIVGIFYFAISFVLEKVPLINLIFLATTVFVVIGYMFIKFNNILYIRSKKIGGRPYKIFSKEKYYDINQHNRKIVSKSEVKLIKNILKTNNMNNIECMKELRENFKYNKKIDKYDETGFSQIVVGMYAIPITFNIISIYTAISKNELQKYIIDIGYIMIFAITIVAIIYIIHIIKKIKMLSITNSYTYPILIDNLTDFIIIESKESKDSIKNKEKTNII